MMSQNAKENLKDGLVLLCILLLVVGGVGTWVSISKVNEHTLVATADAGSFVTATASPASFWDTATSSVETSKGTLQVMGEFSALKGAKLIIRKSKSGMSLCVGHDTASCSSLKGSVNWPMTKVQKPHEKQFFMKRMSLIFFMMLLCGMLGLGLVYRTKRF